MAGREDKPHQWIKSERIGRVTLYLSERSSKWQMYWTVEANGGAKGVATKKRRHQFFKSTGETDVSLARFVAVGLNKELFKCEHFPELQESHHQPALFKPLIAEFEAYLHELGRGYDHRKNMSGRLGYLAEWMALQGLKLVGDVTPDLLREFTVHLKEARSLTASTINHYLDAAHNFFGYVIFKRRLLSGLNPAACGRQAQLERLPNRRLPAPTIQPAQVNAMIAKAERHHDRQVVNLIVFICEGGFRFQELQFLQVRDIDLEQRAIIVDMKRPDLDKVRPELRRRCMTPDGLWLPKTRASRRPVHITDRLANVIGTMDLGAPSAWVFRNSAGNQVAGNKTLQRLKRYALEAEVLVETRPHTAHPWSLIRWHWLRHYHRTRAHVSKIRREVSKVAMGHAGDAIHDHYRGLDTFAFHEEYAKFDSGIDDSLLGVGSSLVPVLVPDVTRCQSAG